MNKALLDNAVQAYIQEHLNDDAVQVALRKSPLKDISSKELAEQIESKQRCEKKLPRWFATPGIYYPPKLAIEQSSSEITAAYKTQLLKAGHVLDLTGGLGVDSFSFSKNAVHVVHCEINRELSDIARHNAGVLGAGNITFVNADGLMYLRDKEQQFDTIYADPSRRVKSRKVFFLKDCEPDMSSNLDLLFSKAGRIIIKTSPLLDITSGLKELKNVSAVHITSIKNEVKELLWVIDRDFTGESEIVCAALNEAGNQTFSFYKDQEKTASVNYSVPLNYLYEPDASLLKAGCFKLVASRFDLFKLEKNTHLYSSDELKENFTGRIFFIKEHSDFKTFTKKRLIKKANIISRNFPLSPAELKKKLGIHDGGDDYLVFIKTSSGELTVMIAERC